ncbi:restriction endonuclease subunit S [Hymenobacter sp. 5516J-16]|uniref:restriction endonuclease subunit S n=1 Tax=Hymenobacter sp. 5516J-16 TaxID=2932253 RepID=UPI001FCF8DAE|nr:restriction endonuclease subunit S [Hymenobacter sp. 5516J-16]UOQ76537.1 restriction endonuclease subunit S [Hymenobacter sp. 5516J-16]
MKKYENLKETQTMFGSIPAHWELKRGKDVISILSGFPFASELFDIDPATGFPLIRIRNVVTGTTDTYYKGDVLPEYVINAGDILIGMDGDYNCAIWNSEPALLNQRVCKVDGKNGLLSKYLFYSLPFHLQVINDLTYFTTVKHLSTHDIKNIVLPVPPVEEQRVIAAYLDRKTAQLDTLLAQKEALLLKLQQKRQALINEAVTQGLNPAAPRKPSGVAWLGEVPAHWEVKRLKQLTTKIGSGVTPLGGAEVYQDKGVPLFRSQNIYSDGLRLDDVAFVTEEVHESMKNSQVEIGDVLLNITGASIGRCYFYQGENKRANVNQHVCIIRPNEQVTTEYLQLVLASNLGQHQIDMSQNGASREGLTFSQLKEFRIPCPAIAEQQVLVQTINLRLQKISGASTAIRTQVRTLKAFRQSLISEVVTGKVDVRPTASAAAPDRSRPTVVQTSLFN